MINARHVILKRRIDTTLDDAVAWCTDPSAPTSAVDLCPDDLAHRLSSFMGAETKDDFTLAETATKHSCYLLERFAALVRPGGSNNTVDVNVFESRAELEKLLNKLDKDGFLEVRRHGTPEACRCRRVGRAVLNRLHSGCSAICELLTVAEFTTRILPHSLLHLEWSLPGTSQERGGRCRCPLRSY